MTARARRAASASAPLVAASARLIAASALLIAASARGDEISASERRATAAHEMNRPYSMLEGSVGVQGLPTQVCLQKLDCSQGEVSLAGGLHILHRYHALAFGAAIELATTLRTDEARGAADLERDHSRRYFSIEPLFRYYFLRFKDIEGWASVAAGLIVVNDSWTTLADREPYSDIDRLGPSASTLGTPGFAAGVGVGGEYSFLHNFSVGPNIQYASWFLPSVRALSPTLDSASLAGQVNMFSLNLVIAYRIAL
jgi:hypothetical protein